MSFYTSLTGLNGAQSDISAISNNIANVGTTGFKRSRAEFGDIFATSPLQAASSAIGSGTILKSIKQQFTQGNIEASLNALDLAISGQGFFAIKPSLTSTQTVYTRNGAFSVNNDRYVVDSQGQLLQVFPVNEDGSVIATGITSAKNLQLPTSTGLPRASKTIQLGLNLPADATIIPKDAQYTTANPYRFDKTNASTYNKSTSITIYDSLGNPTIATIYYVKTSNATETSPTNKWQTYVFVGAREVSPQLITAKDDQSKGYYINKFGQITTTPQSVDPTFNAAAAHPLYRQDDQTNKTPSTSATIIGGIIKTSGFDFGDTDATKVTIVTDPALYATTREGGVTGSNPPYWGVDMFSISVDGSAPQSVSVKAGTYTGTQLAEEMTRAVNTKYSGEKYFRISDTYRREGGAVVTGNDIIQINLSKLSEVDGSSVALARPIEIDLLGTGGTDGTPQVGGATQPGNTLQLTREQLITLAQTKLNDALNLRRLEFGKPASWPDPTNPPIVVGYDIGKRALTFTVLPSQLGADANEPSSRFNSVQVYNPTAVVNDLGLPAKTASTDTLIRANNLWTGTATLPAGDAILDPREQRTGINITYNKDTRQFGFASGSTGEASQITMGRSALATDSDVTSQTDSFDFSTFDYTQSQRIQLEIDGKQFSYDWTGVVGGTAANQAANLFAAIQQAYPVTFTNSKEKTEGTTTVREVQEILVNGGLQKNDVFSLSIAIPGAAAAVTITTDPLAVTSTQTQTQKLDVLVTTLNAKINATAGLAIGGAVNNPATPFMVASRLGNKIIFTYKQEGSVGPLVGIKQTVRGSDTLTTTGNFTATLNFTDATVVKSFYEKTEGNATTVGVHSLTLKSPTGTTPTLAVNDVYRIQLPLADGTLLTRDVTLGATGFAGLAAAANAQTDLATYATFSAEGTDKLVTRYKANGAVTGTMNIEQIKAANVLVRPVSIGAISIKSTGTNLEVDGNPDGSKFRLTLRVNGVVKGSLPVGAGGSTSKNGIMIGQAKQINYLGTNDLLGLGATASTLLKAGTGLISTAAKAVGTRAITPLAQTFFLNESLKENEMTFTVDGIVGTINLPIRAYTGDTFATAIQDRVNQIQDPKTGRIVSGVTVKFEPDSNRLVFTSGTTGANSQMNVVGHPNFGLATVAQSAGTVPIITILKQATDASGNKLYVTTTGAITTTAPTTLQNWYPLYLTEGQLTFDTIGKLISPKEGVVYSPFDPQNGSDLLRLNIDYGKFSTQFSSPFSVLSLSQDGYPSGSLNGLDIDASGTVRANYTNGQTVALGKVMIANFANPNGLKQIGNANYVSTSTSGQVVLGQAGADGFGTIKAGALERSNVDITEELVTLITAQRNFQANAKAIETTTTLSQTIIQIRG